MEDNPTIFEFSSYGFDPEKRRIFFNYKQEFKEAEPVSFTETLFLPEAADLKDIPAGLLDKILQGCHLVLGISYYKFYCSQAVRHNYSLTKKEADFWNVVYKKGLGEFYFKNNLDPKNSPKFSYDKATNPKPFYLPQNNKCLVAVSGGKDSIVAAELLKEHGFDITAVFTEAQRESEIVNKVMDVLAVKSLRFRRILDEKALLKHKYDGHVPVSAMFAFLGMLYAVLYKYSYCVMANEYSSNFGNIKYKGQIINHQWSKSFEFENMFREYADNFITPDIRYFSLLRPFYEIRIAELFSRYKQYFPYFSSCNKNFKLVEEKKDSLWCGQCPKCVFAFILMSAFLKKEELTGIFKKNLYADENLLPLFKDILGLGKMKPFDCVGTFEESKIAFLTGGVKFKGDFIVRQLLPQIKASKGLIKEVFSTKPAPNIPTQFKFLGMKNVLILGYGKEGKVSKKYMEKKFPNLQTGTADEKMGDGYLKKQEKYDIAIKSPGIAREKLKIPYTTATNMFFSETRNMPGVKIVGITGTKGKSTTASLIWHILKKSGKNAELLGNIGKPMLAAVDKKIEENHIFVLELSSYQLDDIEFSPDIALATSVFPEHMNYHGSVKKYYDAKKNIVKFQKPGDVFIFNPKNKKLADWAAKTRAKAIPFAPEKFLFGIKLTLQGEHNKENIRAAAAVAKEFNISDNDIKAAIESFKPLPHRLEFVGQFKGIKFYDDAISTTPESTIAAIKSLPQIGTIFLGGQDRGYKFLELDKIIKKYGIKNIVLFPDSGKKILKSKKGLNVLETKKMKEAVRFAYKYTPKDQVCLLSCASPSYSLWKDFEEKGNEFKSWVKYFSKNSKK